MLLEGGLVGERDFVEALGLEAAEGFGDERVDGRLSVSERGGQDAGRLGGELFGTDLLQADQRSGDRMIRAGHDGGEGGGELAALAEVVFLEDVEAGRAAEAADHGRHGARGELTMEGRLHADEVLVVTLGGLVDERGQTLLIVGAVGVARGVLAHEQRIADDRIRLRLGHGGEDAVEGVVIGGRDRVELVVVATGARDGEAEEALRRGVDALVDGVVVVLEALADGDEAERGEARVVLGEVGQSVGRELFDDELVVRLVGVEGVDDVVAVGPGTVERLDGAVALQALGVGVAGGVEPVAGPAFAVMGRGEQAVDGAFDDAGHGTRGLALAHGHRVVGEGRVIIAGEGVDLDARGRQADQVVGKAAQQGFAVGGRAGLEALLVELSHDEGVDLVLAPGGVAELGRDRVGLDGLEGPVRARLVGETGEFGAAGAGRGGRAHLDPLFDQSDLRGGKFGAGLARRHRDVRIGLMDRDDDQGLLEVAGDDGGSEVAAGQHALTGVHDESALRDALLLRVTFVATLGQDRADVLLEELQAGRIHLRLRGVGGAEAGDRDEGEQTEAGGQGRHGGLRGWAARGFTASI